MDKTFKVLDMTCSHCEATIKKAITRIDPEAKVTIDRSKNKVQVHSSKTHDEIALAITDEGYKIA